MPQEVPEGEAPLKRVAQPPLPLIQDKPDFESYKRSGDTLPTSTMDVLSATWESALDSTAVGILGDKSAMSIIEEMPGQKTLSIAELNQKYMGLGITWTEPKKEGVADWIAEAHQKQQILQNRIALGDGGMIEGSLGFGATMVRHLMDPAEFGLNVLGGAAIRSATIAPAFLRGTTAASTIARGAAEGVLTQIPVEALEVSRNRDMERDVSLAQSMENIAMGAVYGGAMEGVGLAVKSAFANRSRIFGSAAKREWEFAATESAAAQMLDGRRPNIRPLQDVFERERNSSRGPRPEDDFSGRSNYVFNELNTEQAASGKFYVGTVSRDTEFARLNHGEYKNSRTNFGNGAYGQDDAMRANGYAASSFNDAPGLIHEFDVRSAKLLSVDQPLAGAKMEAVEKAVAALREFPELRQVLEEAAKGSPITARQVYEALNDAPEGALEGFNRNLKAEGYDGLHFVDGAKDGSAKANGIMLFPESMDKAVGVGTIEPDARYVAGLEQAEVDDLIRQHNARENRLFQSKDEDLRVEELGKRSEIEPNLEDDILEEAHKDALEQVSALDAEGLLAPEEKALLDFLQGKKVEGEAGAAVENFKESAKLGENVIKAMFSCIGKGG